MKNLDGRAGLHIWSPEKNSILDILSPAFGPGLTPSGRRLWLCSTPAVHAGRLGFHVLEATIQAPDVHRHVVGPAGHHLEQFAEDGDLGLPQGHGGAIERLHRQVPGVLEELD